MTASSGAFPEPASGSRLSAVGGRADSGSGALLGHEVHSGEAVALSDAVRPRGVTVIGKTGTGKSTLLEQLLLADLRRGTPAVVIDPHGRLASRVLTLAPPGATDRLILLEPWPDRPFRLNLLDCPDPANPTALDRTVDHAVEVFKKLFDRSGEYLPRLERDLDAAIRTVIPNRGTLLDVLRVFGDPRRRVRYRAAVRDDTVQEYWDFFERLGREAEQARQVEATVNRLYKLLAPQLIRQLVDTRTTTVPFDDVLAGNRMLLLSIPARDLTPKRCDFLGALFLGALTDRIFAREAATTDPPRLHLYIDEYARFATPMTAELFPEGRKYGVGLTVAHQTLAQVTDEAIQSAERQVGALVLFQLIGPDAEELAGELDTTPVRTKTVMRQRTIPQYAYDDVEVWDDPAREREYDELQPRLATLRETLGTRLARSKARYHILEGAYTRYDDAGCGPPFAELLTASTKNVCVHLPFNFHWKTRLRLLPGQTVGGLQRVGPPDFWMPEQPAVVREYLCEGYLLRSEGSVRLQGHAYPLELEKLSSRLSVELEEFIRSAKQGWHELWQKPSFSYPNPHGGQRTTGFLQRWGEELKLLSTDDFADIAQELADEVNRVLDAEYRQVLFWFSPYSYSAAASADSDRTLPPDVQARLDADTAWLVASRPALGQERKLRWGTFPGTADSIPLDEQWPRVGCWQLTAFPRAVAWLKQWTRDAQREIAGLQAQWDRSGRPVEERVHYLEQTYRKRVVRERHIGDLPAKRTDPLADYRRNWRGKYPPPPPKEDQWYDRVEELDQTHADRRLELANELVNLPPFTAYVRTATDQHHVALVPPAGRDIDESRIERIRQISKARFGRPPGPPEPPAPPLSSAPPPRRPPAPSAGPRIGREHPDEE